MRYASTVYRQVAGIPMRTNYALRVADMFLYCFEGECILGLPPVTQTDIIKAFNPLFV